MTTFPLDRGDLGALAPDWYDQEAHQHPDAVVMAMEGDGVVRALPEADPPPAPPGLDLGGRPDGSGGPEDETMTAPVHRVSSTGGGLQLRGDVGWLNVGRYSKVTPADLLALLPGDQVTVTFTTAGSGQRYLTAVRLAEGAGAGGETAWDNDADDGEEGTSALPF